MIQVSWVWFAEVAMAMSPSAVLSATIDEITTSTPQHATSNVHVRWREMGGVAVGGVVSARGLTTLALSAMRPPSGSFKTDDLQTRLTVLFVGRKVN
ncbi:Uncharacterised protein [Mycobacteroides abscessus subsp. abscessus]|nr:Uncharacterised protein [Mycobacteroides abscessus subsp. abscessus]